MTTVNKTEATFDKSFHALQQNTDLSHSEKALISLILSYQTQGLKFFMGDEGIAARLATRPNQIQRWLLKLKKSGHIVVTGFTSTRSIVVNQSKCFEKKDLLFTPKEKFNRGSLTAPVEATTSSPAASEEQIEVVPAAHVEVVEDGIDAFINAYPKPPNIREVKAAWKREEDKPAIDVLLASLDQYAVCRAWKKSNGRFITSATQFIERRLWTELPKGVKPPIKFSKPTVWTDENEWIKNVHYGIKLSDLERWTKGENPRLLTEDELIHRAKLVSEGVGDNYLKNPKPRNDFA